MKNIAYYHSPLVTSLFSLLVVLTILEDGVCFIQGIHTVRINKIQSSLYEFKLYRFSCYANHRRKVCIFALPHKELRLFYPDKNLFSIQLYNLKRDYENFCSSQLGFSKDFVLFMYYTTATPCFSKALQHILNLTCFIQLRIKTQIQQNT